LRILPAGQCLKHEIYGFGVTKSSNEAKTVIDFYEHGQKIFVTGLLSAELLDEPPPRPAKPKTVRRKKKTAE
jgi:hypothetical protein